MPLDADHHCSVCVCVFFFYSDLMGEFGSGCVQMVMGRSVGFWVQIRWWVGRPVVWSMVGGRVGGSAVGG